MSKGEGGMEVYVGSQPLFVSPSLFILVFILLLSAVEKDRGSPR
jgi:hypothetical protein